MASRLIVLSFLLFQFQSSIGQVLFTWQEPQFGYCVPTEVLFTDITSPVPTSWQWMVTGPENMSAIIQNPGFTFVVPGDYTVCLSVNNNPTPIFCEDFTFFAPPSAQFGIGPGSVTTGCAPLIVCFENLSVPGSCPIDSVIWDLGIPPTGNDNDPCVIYPGKDQIQVTLVVIDECGCQDEVNSVENYIEIFDPPAPTLMVDPTFSCTIPFNVTVTNTSFMQAGTVFTWEFPGLGVSPSEFEGYDPGIVNYTQAGSFDIKLTADDNGCTKDTTLEDVIVIDPLVAAFEVSDITPCVGQVVQFTNTSNLQVLDCSWFIDNSMVSMDCIFNYSFSAPGQYEIMLVASTFDGMCIDSISQTVDVLTSAEIDFTADNTSACSTPFTVNFTSSAPDAVSYNWSILPPSGGTFNDSSSSNPQATFTAPGSYGISLSVISANGCQGEVVKENYITINDSVEVDIITNVNGYEGCVPLNICFGLNVQNLPVGASVASVTWSTPGGSPASGNDLNYCSTYTVQGDFIVTADVVFTGGCTPATISKTIHAGNLPNLTAVINPGEVCINECVTGSATSDQPGTEFDWYFEAPGGHVYGGIGTTTTVGYCYGDEWAQPFTAHLVGNVNGCRDTVNLDVFVNPPVAQFDWVQLCNQGTEVSFDADDAQGVFTDSGGWYIDDVTVHTFNNIADADFTYDFGSIGFYDVQLVVSSSFTGCTDSVTRDVDLFFGGIDFVGSQPLVANCPPLTVNFFTIPPGAPEGQLYWYFEPGAAPVITNPPHETSHIYLTRGPDDAYFDVAIAYDSGDPGECRDSIVKDDYVFVGGQAGTLSFMPDSGEAPLEVMFTLEDLNGVDSIYWDFGNGDFLSTGVDVTDINVVYDEIGEYLPAVLLESSDCPPLVLMDGWIYVYEIAGVDDALSNVVSLFPNPLSANRLLQWRIPGDMLIEQISIVDISGRALYVEQNPERSSTKVDFLPSGVYSILFQTNLGIAGKLFEVVD